MDTQQLTVKMALHAWDVQVGRAEKMFQGLNDEQLWQEIAPGKNRGIYLLGHLVAVNEGMLKLFGLSDRKYTAYDTLFVSAPDKSGLDFPPTPSIRESWYEVHQELWDRFNRMSPEEWFQRHNSMTDEDFIKEPHRNKLSVLLNRTAHVAYHLGQVALIKK